MNNETFEYLKSVILRLDTAGHGVKFTGAEAYNLSYSLKHLVVNELRTDGKYEQANEVEAEYGIH